MTPIPDERLAYWRRELPDRVLLSQSEGRELFDEIEALRKALRTIAYEPIGHPETSTADFLGYVVEIARAALPSSPPPSRSAPDTDYPRPDSDGAL